MATLRERRNNRNLLPSGLKRLNATVNFALIIDDFHEFRQIVLFVRTLKHLISETLSKIMITAIISWLRVIFVFLLEQLSCSEMHLAHFHLHKECLHAFKLFARLHIQFITPKFSGMSWVSFGDNLYIWLKMIDDSEAINQWRTVKQSESVYQLSCSHDYWIAKIGFRASAIEHDLHWAWWMYFVFQWWLFQYPNW